MSEHERHQWTLSDDDRRLLDALVASGFDPQQLEPLSEAQRRRVDAMMRLFAAFTDYPSDDEDSHGENDGDTLIDATMSRIDRYERFRRAPAEAVERYSHYGLSTADQQLLDALIEVEFDIAQLGPLNRHQQRRAEIMTRLFTLLEDYPVEDGNPELVELVMSRLDEVEAEIQAATSRRDEHVRAANGRLVTEDARLLDALAENDFDSSSLASLTEQQQRRVHRLQGVFQLLEAYPVEDGDPTLIDATMARVQQHDFRRLRIQAAAERSAAPDPKRRRRIRMPDFISVAAVLLLCASVLWPMWDHVSEQSGDSGAGGLRLSGDAARAMNEDVWRDGGSTLAGFNSPFQADEQLDNRSQQGVDRAQAVGEDETRYIRVRMPDGRIVKVPADSVFFVLYRNRANDAESSTQPDDPNDAGNSRYMPTGD